jgi:hypothetical protein
MGRKSGFVKGRSETALDNGLNVMYVEVVTTQLVPYKQGA